MKIIFTGLNGTVAPVVADHFKQKGHTIVQYKREVVGVDDPERIETFIRTEAPDMLMHFATGPAEWSEHLASITKRLNVKFVFISTVSVFGDSQTGPFTPDIEPEPSDEYGRYKYNSERMVLTANDSAWIIRLGWQIGRYPGTNNMIDFLDKKMKEKGRIKASKAFYPAASFMEDTARGIEQAINQAPDIYHIDSNKSKSFYEIVETLKETHPFIVLKEGSNPEKDIRMRDARIEMPTL